MAKLARKRQEASGRKSQRMADAGRAFEEEVAGILERMLEEKLISGFVAHAPHSSEDAQGRDFTVTSIAGGKTVERSFGVTISLKRWQRSKILHPDVPQFCFPLGTKPETVRKRILELFA